MSRPTTLTKESKGPSCVGCANPIEDRKYISCSECKCKKTFHLSCVNIKQLNPDTAKSWLCPACRGPACGGCANPIEDKKIITCSEIKCKKPFHLPCVNIKQINSDTVKTWLCPICRCAMKKGGDNSTTPVRTVSQNNTVRKPLPASPESIPPVADNSSALALKEEMKRLGEEIRALKTGFDSAISTVTRCESQLNVLCTKMSSYEAQIIQIEEKRAAEMYELKTANDGLQAQVAIQSQVISTFEVRIKTLEDMCSNGEQIKKTEELLEERMRFQEQALLRNDIEITGVTERPTENVYHLFLMIAALVGMKLAESDVDYVVRAGPLRNKPNDPPRPIVVRFCRRHTRDQFYKTAKPKRLTTNDLEIEGPVQSIFCNERLTRDNRYLFRECRTQFKAAGYKFCWTKWGQIYVKKREGKGEEAKAIIIKSHGHIAGILNRPGSAPTGFGSPHKEE